MQLDNVQEFMDLVRSLLSVARKQGMVVSKSQCAEKLGEYYASEDKKPILDTYLQEQGISVCEDDELDHKISSLEEFEKDFSKMDEDYVRDYLEDLEYIEVLSREQLVDLSKKALEGEEQAIEQLTLHYLKDVVSLTKLYSNQGVLIQDLIGEGNVALMKSMKLLSVVESPEEIEGFVISFVMKELERFVYEEQDASLQVKSIASRLSDILECIQKLKELTIGEIKSEDIMSELSLTQNEVDEALELSGMSLEQLIKLEHIQEDHNEESIEEELT